MQLQFLWFFLSVFCGIMGGCVVLQLLYRFTVEMLSGLHLRRETENERKSYGRKPRKNKRLSR